MIYLPGSGILHRLHPLTKLAAALLIVVAASMFPSPPLLLGALALLLLLALAAGVARRLLPIMVSMFLPLIASLFLIQGVLFPPANATTLVALGPVRLTIEGLAFAGLIAGRLLVTGIALLLTLLTTHPADLVVGLGSIGLPRSAGYVLLVALQLVPDMVARAGAILEAQQSRGLEVGRGLARLRALPALVGPLLVGALSDVEERAMAIEARGFLSPGPKTSLRTLQDDAVQRAARLLFVLGVVAVVVLRVWMLRANP
ncbi:MAG: energy-coupling factor transporter transmembrane protein EcfT [Roseiflexaceae bacterium]|nr:energy-coupling factor transporter transmembrane protein EcfT [Roseiflexaceae bacterium]